MDNPPIGILSRNRASYLDVTLRSLSATTLPDGVSVRVFDDASDDTTTLGYYKCSDTRLLNYTWPVDKKWTALGFSILPTGEVLRSGIANKVHITRAKSPRGVVAASCAAVQQLFEDTDAAGVFLLQDDVLFNADWYHRMLDTVARSAEFTPKPVGVLAGIKLNHSLHVKAGQLAVPSGITAQCLYISRQAFDSVPFLTQPPNVKQRFDDLLRKSVERAGMWGGVIYPFVCQHIGVKSLVRPHKRWAVGSTVRVGLYSMPPYAMSDEVRQWK